jgi:aryl-alcohol dehydrogenase-like predicted oxidoreductase
MSALMKYKLLGRTGVRVSELCLGTMTFGGNENSGMWNVIGKVEDKSCQDIFKLAYDSGINFFDTANIYHYGQSETILANSIVNLGINRHNLFIATKVRGRMDTINLNNQGLSRLHIHRSVNESLKRMNHDHIDLLYIHGFDALTPIEETMSALNDLVRVGKVRYIGACNIPAWQVVKGNLFAEKYGWARFEALQYYYSIAGRDIEREIVPMARDQGLSIMPWSPLAGGFLSGKYTRKTQNSGGQSRRDNFDFPPVDKEKAYDIIEEMEKIAKGKGVSVAQIALSWVLHQSSVTSCIIGAKKVEQVQDNIDSVKISFSEPELKTLNELSKLKSEYPQWMIDLQSVS